MCLDLYNEFVKCIECSLPQPTHLVSSGKKDSMGGPVGLKITSNTVVFFPSQHEASIILVPHVLDMNQAARHGHVQTCGH